MRSGFLFLILIILYGCTSLRPVSGTILDKQTKQPVIGAKVYNSKKTYESALSDSTGHFYFLCVRSLVAIKPLKIAVEKELYKPTQFKYRKIESKEILLEAKKKSTNYFNKIECLNDTFEGQKVYDSVDKMPEFITGEAGLMKYIFENTNFPDNQKYGDPQSKFRVTFIIDILGKVKNECIHKIQIKEIISAAEAEVLRVVREMPDWKPGEQNGKKVPVRMTIPLRFCFK